MFDFFLPFDTIILSMEHILAMPLGFILTPVCEGISLMISKGGILLIIGFILLFNKNTRKWGLGICSSIAVAYLFNGLVFKNIFQRPRPFVANEIFNSYRQFINASVASGFSFPSGHTVCAAAGCFGFVFTTEKEKRKLPITVSIIFIIAVAFSRTYLMHHYPTDCIFGALEGIILSFVVSLIINWFYGYCEKNTDKKFCDFVLNWSIFGNKQ